IKSSDTKSLGLTYIFIILNIKASLESSEGIRNCQGFWEIAKLHNQKTRFVVQRCEQGIISKKVIDFCIKNRLIDGNLVAKWKQVGYESLCCMACITKSNTNYETNCICRVPKNKRNSDRIVKCNVCGCAGCSH
ncbi:MAG: G10 protein, partial [Paramarteilia canceri]